MLITLKYGDIHNSRIQLIWEMLSHKPDNVINFIKFLLEIVMIKVFKLNL